MDASSSARSVQTLLKGNPTDLQNGNQEIQRNSDCLKSLGVLLEISKGHQIVAFHHPDVPHWLLSFTNWIKRCNKRNHQKKKQIHLCSCCVLRSAVSEGSQASLTMTGMGRKSERRRWITIRWIACIQSLSFTSNDCGKALKSKSNRSWKVWSSSWTNISVVFYRSRSRTPEKYSLQQNMSA